jgi:putative PIN family toxin of toxin-antitoxin system
MKVLQLVVDTNVIVTGFMSRRGASFALLQRFNDERWQINLSPALAFEYEETLRRTPELSYLTAKEIGEWIEDLCSIAKRHHRFPFRWRPLASDPDDDFVLELAINASADYIISYNERHLRAANKFGVQVVTPVGFLQAMGELK